MRGDPRYKQMSPKEVIDKFVSFELNVYYCVAGQAVDVKKLAFKFEDEGE